MVDYKAQESETEAGYVLVIQKRVDSVSCHHSSRLASSSLATSFPP